MAVIYDATRESITEILTELQNEVEQFNSYGTQFRISYSHRLALSTDYNECTLRTLLTKQINICMKQAGTPGLKKRRNRKYLIAGSGVFLAVLFIFLFNSFYLTHIR